MKNYRLGYLVTWDPVDALRFMISLARCAFARTSVTYTAGYSLFYGFVLPCNLSTRLTCFIDAAD
jgi:hypothetical protein